MKDKKNTRFVIIGAGAAGLTAASSLHDQGYENIVILERETRAGGKCSTVNIDGKNYELGAGMIAESDATVMQLVKKYDIKLKRVEFGKSMVVRGKDNLARKKRSVRETLKLTKQVLINYRAVHKKYSHLTKPGFSNIDHEELSIPFAQFAKKYKFEALASELELSHTGFGYGYFSDVPAAYVLKYYSWNTMMSFIKQRMYFFPDGTEQLWTKVAQDFDVMYGSIIESVVRDTNVSITIRNQETGNIKTMIYDKLIVTSPLDELLSFIDGTPDEQKLFNKIKHVDYRTVACELSGFPKMTGYVPDNFSPSRAGHPVFWYHRHYDSDTYTFYVLASGDNMNNDIITKYISDFVGSMNGTVQRVHIIKHWKYFPHVSSDIFKSGFYDKLEAIQGQHNTYYAGELMNFSTVGLTSDYAYNLIKKNF
ncbi:NAD(P)-binding protein [Candidatus Parcubacteria bacterium]|nr:NAD(P)-binding protein [Candidatus Parcubacteria bacterium]MBT3949189.1 NAD(P)-binding protein [Candidatus Parcubacteria bacterium]